MADRQEMQSHTANVISCAKLTHVTDTVCIYHERTLTATSLPSYIPL